jgi:DNA (cytosine-5)-methyltransferase 1
MTKYKEWQINDSIGLLVGGTPCQSFSVAGLRKGLEDPRGNLALTYVGILDHFRPKWFVWENVPGVLSSNQGRDFAAFLTALGIIGYGWSYRVLDAQYFGVAQRRRRVFVVGHFGDWRPTAEVLFESDCLRRDTKKGKRKGEEIARCLTTNIGTRYDGETDTFVTKVYENHPSDSRVKEMGDICQTVTSSWGTGGGNIPFVQNISPIAFTTEQTPKFNNEQALTLTQSEHKHNQCVLNKIAVRRLTPLECERLQGFPDNYTNIKENCPDGARYKALGNSMAVPVMRWIGERINSYETMRSSAVVQVETGVGLAEV